MAEKKMVHMTVKFLLTVEMPKETDFNKLDVCTRKEVTKQIARSLAKAGEMACGREFQHDESGSLIASKTAWAKYDLKFVERTVGDVAHISQEEWERRRETEREGVNHPCDHWCATDCMCQGSCSCHWQQDKK